jgi:hypothetical protein
MPTPKKSLDDLPLAAYGGTGMEEGPETAEPDMPAASGPLGGVESVDAAAAAIADESATRDAAPGSPPAAGLPARLVTLLRTSRIAQGGAFVVVILVGLILLSGSTASPNATAATPTQRPTVGPTIVPPSGDASLVLSGGVTGTFALTGLAGGQHVTSTAVDAGWGDALQTTLTIAGPADRGTRTTDERLVLTIVVPVADVPVTFTSAAGECTIGMAPVGTAVQGSFTCHKLKSADGKLTIEASGTYRT